VTWQGFEPVCDYGESARGHVFEYVDATGQGRAFPIVIADHVIELESGGKIWLPADTFGPTFPFL
jgi:hypothetical protein